MKLILVLIAVLAQGSAALAAVPVLVDLLQAEAAADRKLAAWTLGEIGFNAVGPALISNIAPADLRGRYNGVAGMAFGASAFVAPLAGTWVFDALGETTLWTMCFALQALSAVAILALRPMIRTRQAALEATESAEV